ncbi:acrosomal protein KIAA1210 homolog isoform X3 [Aquarana catesbeiana]|uniref:acrosomal protein KIAA1210 homolog isoform X3 n=1 Tax=Aquarana catesbeiana TaxID=8400 RepID=UPI003CC9712B
MSALYSCLKGKNDTIMAAKSAEGTQTIENEETPGDCSGKKKSKFQAFKKLFVKKKRKESPAPSRESNLKPSQSSSDVSVSGANESAFQPAHESVAKKSSMGSKAVSHDSVFISEVENSTKEDTSQENTPGKVKALQLQLQQNIRIGSPPQGILHKKLEDSGALSEDDGLPRSPPEITSLHEILALSSGKTPGIAQRRSSLSLGGTDSEDEPEFCETSSCPISPLNSSTLLSSNSPGSHYLVDFTAPPSSVACLDNSAAKHKIAVKPKKKKGPVINIHRIKDGTGFTKDLHIKLKEKMENKVACEHEVHIPYTGDSSAEQEVPKEQAKCIEDKVEETETDTMSLTAQEEDSSVEKMQSYGTCFTEKQKMSLLDESDVDFHVSLTVEDQVNGNEEETEIERKSTGVPQISQSTPMHELNEVTAQLEPSEMEDNAVETVHLEVGEDVECDIFEDPLKTQKNTLAFETDEPIFNHKDQKHKEYGKVLPNLTELQKDIFEVTASTLDTHVISIPQKHIMETKSDISIIKVDEPFSNVASECVLIFESTDNEKTSETLQESSTNATTDQPTIIDTLSTDEKVETLGLRISETPNYISVNDSHSKCSTCSINLGSGENSSAAIQYTNEYSTETSKTIKTTASNVDSKLRTSNKPVRFTVAPAWQRSLSVGSSVKDSTYSKNKIYSAMKSESFDGSEDTTMGINPEDYRKGENKEESGVAFGIRLRRTSSSRKYNEEYPEAQSKLYPFPVEAGSIVPTQTVQTPTKTAQLQSETLKDSKPSHNVEDKPQKIQKAEDLSLHESSEPSWITVAKLKQKGFQDHPLSREHSAMAEGDKSEGDGESSQKRSAAASVQELDVKETEPISTESPVIQNSLPESGKNAQSTPPQNPDEPPWFSLAKKKAKAWSKMPQIVQ